MCKTLITLRCDDSKPLEERINLLTYSFAKIVQGGVLKQIVKWDISHGCVQFIIEENTTNPLPTGIVSARLEVVDVRG